MIVTSNAVDEPWSMGTGGSLSQVAVDGGGSAREWRELMWDNGDRYEGEWVGDLMHGRGSWVAANGERYEGEWRDGERHGRGLFTGLDGETYDGQWEDGVEHGRGLYADPEDGWILALWEDGDAVQILRKGNVGEEPPSSEDSDAAGAQDDAESAVSVVSEPGGAAGDVEQSADTRRPTQEHTAAPIDSGVGIDIGEQGTPETVDDVMACLRKELKNRRAMGNAKGFFAFFDADGDGDVDGDEFKSALSQLLPMLSQDLLEAVYREVDADGDGNVDYGEFASRMFQKPGMKRPTAPKRGRPGERQKRRGRAFKPGVAEALDPISAHLEQLKKFSYVSKKKRKDGERTDGRTVADSEAIKLSEEELLARQVDNIFRVIRQQMEGARTLYGKKLKDARQAFQLMDKDGDGTLDEAEFMQAMTRLGVGLSENQLSKVMRAIDTDGEGSIDYNEFVEKVGLDDGDGKVAEQLSDAEALQMQLQAANAAQMEAAGGGGLAPCAFEFAEAGYTGLTFGDIEGWTTVTGVVGGPAEALSFGDFGLCAGARLTAVNAKTVSAQTLFVDAIRMLQKAVRPLILSFDVQPIVVEVKVSADSGCSWLPGMVTAVRVQYEYDADGNLSGPITRGNAVQNISVEMLPIGDGLTFNGLPSDRVRLYTGSAKEQAFSTAEYLKDKAAKKQLRQDLAKGWMEQADSLTHAASRLPIDSEDAEKSELLTKAWAHYHEALGHALAVADSGKGKQMCAELYTKRSKLQIRRAKGDGEMIELAKQDAEHALALDPTNRDAHQHKDAVLGLIWSGRDGDSAAVQEIQSRVRAWLLRKGKSDAEAAAAKYGAIWRAKAARRAAPERRRRAKLSQRGRELFMKAQKLLREIRPCGSLVRVETMLADAQGMAERSQDSELQAHVEGLQKWVAARKRAERHEVDARKIELAMGAAQSKLVREPYLELFTGGSTETVGGRPLF